jgi:hypothetical protein
MPISHFNIEIVDGILGKPLGVTINTIMLLYYTTETDEVLPRKRFSEVDFRNRFSYG